MSARDTLTGLYTDAGFKQFGAASKLATELYDRIRREVLDDLSRSGTGVVELHELGSLEHGDGHPAMTYSEVSALWHKIRGAALLQAAEQLNQDSGNAVHPKVQWTLAWAAMRVHKMIINPEGASNGEAQRGQRPEGDPGVVREGGERGQSRGDGPGAGPEPGADRG